MFMCRVYQTFIEGSVRSSNALKRLAWGSSPRAAEDCVLPKCPSRFSSV